MAQQQRTPGEQKHDVQIAVISSDILNIKNSITKIEALLTDQSDKYVTHDQFWPVKTAVYGMIGLILTSSIGAVIALVLKA
jgi:hypothetical protein